jgi:hypothetical protein
MVGIGALSAAYIDRKEAVYYFTSTMDNPVFTFFATFVKETANGESGPFKALNYANHEHQTEDKNLFGNVLRVNYSCFVVRRLHDN